MVLYYYWSCGEVASLITGLMEKGKRDHADWRIPKLSVGWLDGTTNDLIHFDG
jgi:hypothetical protein